MQKKALIVWGGWDGHEPEQVSRIFKGILEKEGFGVTVSDTLDAFSDGESLKSLDLIVPEWTMGTIAYELCKNVIEAVASGVGIAGVHGGMCDSFRDSVEWQFMTGGQWVAHPGGDGTPYRVHFTNSSSTITDGLTDFDIASEQYYMHVDPAVEVLATTDFPTVDGFHAPNKKVSMPVAWTKRWGKGRVFYSSLGHLANVFDNPQIVELTRRGFNWAAK